MKSSPRARTLALTWLLALTLIAGCGARRPPPAPAAAGAVVKLSVEANGLVEVSAAELAAAGFDLAAATPDNLMLSAGGEPVAFQVVGGGAARTLRFYGQAAPGAAHTAHNIYWLSRASGSQAETLAATASARPPARGGTSVVTATVRAEEQRHFLGSVGPNDDRWLWLSLFAPAEQKATLAAPAATGAAAALRLRVWGNSSAPAAPDHHLVLTLNGTPIADAAWDGAGAHEITATISAGIVRSGDNQLALRLPGDTGAPADAVLLDWIELTYERTLSLGEGQLAFAGPAVAYEIETAGPVAAIWDVTDPLRPTILTDWTATGGRLRFAASAMPGGMRRWVVAAAGGFRKPAAVTPAGDVLPWTQSPLLSWPGGADLIVVTAPQLQEALTPLTQARQAAGMRVAVVTAGQVYDAFNYGRPAPEAIQALVRRAIAAWPPPAPRYLLLAGDASYDPRGYLRGSEGDLIPTHLVNTSFTGWTASDAWFALPDAGPDARPSLAVGRLPAQNAEQLATMVAKTLEWERGDRSAAWRGRALLLADDDEPAFAAEAQAFAEALPGAAQVVTIEGDGAAARATLLTALNDGLGLVGYIGHGSLNLWAQEKILAVDDIGRLNNRERLPIALTLTCLSGFFQHPATVSLGESLVRARGGGAVAAIVPSSAAVLDDQRLLAAEIARGLADSQNLTLGDALLTAQRRLPPFPASDGVSGVREIMLTYNLLGDPTLRLR
jgi:hypothetical protein